jgi:predicted TPR repeat methyltransferase
LENTHDPVASAPLSIDAALRRAMADHQGGRLQDAALQYQAILAAAPHHPDALHFLGVLLHQNGQSDDALPLLQRALDYAPDYVEALNNLGNIQREIGQTAQAEASYRRVIALRPDFVEAWNNLGVVLKAQGKLDEAIAIYRHCVALAPAFATCRINLGVALGARGERQAAIECYRQALAIAPLMPDGYRNLARELASDGQFDEALANYRQWQAIEPDNTEIAHLIAAANGAPVPVRANDIYIQQTFDRFAASFDAALEHLDYCAPALCGDLLRQLLGAATPALDILDAGCGTGLCAPYLAPYARSLEGVDLSSKMLAFAARRGTYRQLHEAEVTAWLQEHPGAYDVIVSADTLCYFGRLDAVLAAATQALRPGGHMVFTLENTPPQPNATGKPSGMANYTLHSHGRYSHGEEYVRSILDDVGLTRCEVQQIVLRKEAGVPVKGMLICAGRPALPAALPRADACGIPK